MVTQHNEAANNVKIQEEIKGTVFNIQRYSIQDGPGIRTTVFLKGCPLRCLWCSNPESQKVWPEVVHRDTLCNACGRCLAVCPEQAISIRDKTLSVDRKLCTNCGHCVEVCVPGALFIYGKTLSVKEVFEEVRKDTDFYHSSGGGVTVSGGEPLSQADFVAALFKLCQDRGIDTCIETSGFASRDALEKVLPLTTLVLFDIKLPDLVSHQKWTGQSNRAILDNLSLLVSRGVPVILRIPLIPGINDTEDELRKLAQIALSYLRPPRKVNLLPYHRFALGKYAMLDREYSLTELITQKEAEIQKAKSLFESMSLECEVVL
jgi:pyruvate formate lyase activating enzyme